MFGLAAGLLPAALVASLLRDGAVVACLHDADMTARTYVASAFDLRDVRLRAGERMTVAVAKDPCLALGQSSRIFIFERTRSGYRRVLSAVTLPEFASVSANGTVTLPTHETISTILESAYVWNGDAYAFSAARSTIYDVPLGSRRPYEVAVRFAPGTDATILRGSTATNFGQAYVFRARAGQHVSISIRSFTGRRPAVVFSLGERTLAMLDSNRWSGTLPRSGDYVLDVFGINANQEDVLRPFEVELEIH